ncbi:PRA1 family protein 2 [Platysternon megacephalum]|uniref:PRA1 family protein 2 n=1 Tax=Platysternon megacephalum TaxID=55544 RepID=A0A4D9DLZ1_9SAUR|nr:PRA1 family protein 2 [Platysternon megacephalum]
MTIWMWPPDTPSECQARPPLHAGPVAGHAVCTGCSQAEDDHVLTTLGKELCLHSGDPCSNLCNEPFEILTRGKLCGLTVAQGPRWQSEVGSDGCSGIGLLGKGRRRDPSSDSSDSHVQTRAGDHPNRKNKCSWIVLPKALDTKHSWACL